MNNRYRTSGLLYLLSAACFFIVGVVGIIHDGTMPYMFIGLSCAFFCLGCVNLRKAKEDSDEQNDDRDGK